MNIADITVQEMPLLKRKEVRGTLQFSGATPARAALTAELASRYHAAENTIIVKQIHATFGFQQAGFTAYVYDSPESKQLIEPKPGEKKGKKAKALEKKE
ncbi:30S ribosomal protein S24e [Candidatus Woesearchaeota archaeon]|nr:30S ribosomal protein S24e [Candidatus Woesearchaeota archaeon]